MYIITYYQSDEGRDGDDGEVSGKGVGNDGTGDREEIDEAKADVVYLCSGYASNVELGYQKHYPIGSIATACN